MMDTIEYRNARGRSVEEIAALGGWFVGPSYFPGDPMLHERWAWPIREAQKRNPEVRGLLRVRFELGAWGESPDGTWGGVPLHYILNDPERSSKAWEEAGFEIDTGLYGQHAYSFVQHAYWTIVWDDKTMRPGSWICDIASSEYRRWAMLGIFCAARYYGMDAVLVGYKPALFDTPEEAVFRPDGLNYLNGYGAAVSFDSRAGKVDHAPIWERCPYPEGAYAQGMAKATRWLSGSIPILAALSFAKSGPFDGWDWIKKHDASFEQRVMGQARMVR
jgi:hypothetical protein